MSMLHAIVASKVGSWLTEHGITPAALQTAMREGRSIIAEAVADYTPDQIRSLPQTYRQQLLAWDANDYHAVLQSLASTHRGHADLLVTQEGFWRYLVPEMEKAKATLRSAGERSA